MRRVTIHVCSKDRHSELALLLQSLRMQSFQNWDLILLDDASGHPIMKCGFLNALLSRLRLENHGLKLLRNEHSYGVCHARNRCIEEDDFDNELTCRLDDDVVLKGDYLQRLIDVIDIGFDVASGIIPPIMNPIMKRQIKFVKPIINEHKLDNKGNLIKQNDDCGFGYVDEVIIPTHQFRTNALYKSEINKKVRYPTNLTFTGFREEGFFSFKAMLRGYTLAVNTGAIAYHFITPSGGVRVMNYNENVAIDDESFKKWVKKKYEKYGNFIEKYNDRII